MAKAVKLEPRTIQFIDEHRKLKSEGKMLPHKELIELLNINSIATISEILGKRLNIQLEQWELFKKHFNVKDDAKYYNSREMHNSDFSEPPSYVSENSIAFSKGELISLFKELALAGREEADRERKEKERILKDNTKFLQDLVKSNLKDTLQAVQDAHHELLTHIKAFERWEALRRTNGDKKKAKTLLAELGTIVGDVDAELISIGNPSTLSNQSSD